MFVVGFFTGLLLLLVIDLMAGAYQKHRSNKKYAEELK
jgi:hypothetical protein